MLNWFRRRRSSDESSAAAPVPGDVAPESAPESVASTSLVAAASPEAPGDQPAPAAPPWRDAYDEDTVRETIVARLHDLLDQLPDAMRRTDAPAVLGALEQSMDTAIGQPPLAAQRALSVSRDPDSSVADLVALFETDPGLAQGLLRYANSSHYAGLGGSCTSLSAAVQRVGSAGVENVVLSATLRGVLCRPGGHYDAMVEMVWSHMVRCGPIAREIAPVFGVDPERGFALALLHDAGKLILFDRISSFRKSQRREVDIPDRLLHWALKRLHEPLGGLAALRWRLPENAARAISRHHREPAPEHPDVLSEVIFVAEKYDLATQRGLPVELDAWWEAGALTGHLEAAKSILAEPDQMAA